jgi:hypothetical protein
MGFSGGGAGATERGGGLVTGPNVAKFPIEERIEEPQHVPRRRMGVELLNVYE